MKLSRRQLMIAAAVAPIAPAPTIPATAQDELADLMWKYVVGGSPKEPVAAGHINVFGRQFEGLRPSAGETDSEFHARCRRVIRYAGPSTFG